MMNDETRDQSENTPERAPQMKSWEVTDEAWEAFESAPDLCAGVQAAYEAGRRAGRGRIPQRAHASRRDCEEWTMNTDLEDVLERLNVANDRGEIDYDLYRELHDLVSAVPDVEPGEHGGTIPLYGVLDLWSALHGTSHPEFEEFYEQHGYAEAWAGLLAMVRSRAAAPEGLHEDHNDPVYEYSLTYVDGWYLSRRRFGPFESLEAARRFASEVRNPEIRRRTRGFEPGQWELLEGEGS